MSIKVVFNWELNQQFLCVLFCPNMLRSWDAVSNYSLPSCITHSDILYMTCLRRCVRFSFSYIYSLSAFKYMILPVLSTFHLVF
jgi:hypothetical protein